MSREFKSFGSFAAHLMEMATIESRAMHAGLKAVGNRVEKNAKDEIGFYQEAIGPFPAWDPLADSTETDKARLGFQPDAPLLREGNMRDSYGNEVKVLEVIIGNTTDEAVYQELGTEHIPPRPVLGPAVLHAKDKIIAILGAAAVSGIIGADRIHEGLGYDFGTD